MPGSHQLTLEEKIEQYKKTQLYFRTCFGFGLLGFIVTIIAFSIIKEETCDQLDIFNQTPDEIDMLGASLQSVQYSPVDVLCPGNFAQVNTDTSDVIIYTSIGDWSFFDYGKEAKLLNATDDRVLLKQNNFIDKSTCRYNYAVKAREPAENERHYLRADYVFKHALTFFNQENSRSIDETNANNITKPLDSSCYT